ncbi:alanine racemase [Alphaproteobacteria bacterium]|jgi:alanine racemase|nr:alanine racemase [Alphaproteobacteria bacterium]
MAIFDRLIAEINLNAIVGNWRRCHDLSGHATTAAVVKADGYGHGAEAVAAALYAAGCQVFFTASADEAALIRPHVGDARIGYFDGLFAGDLDIIREYDLIPSINDPQQLELLPRLSGGTGLAETMLQLDTGMNRLGIDWRWLTPDTAEKCRQSSHISLIYSHLSSADDPNSAISNTQLDRFKGAAAMMPDIPASMAASGGILRGDDFHLDMVRPGIALYGYPPVPANGFTPALTLKARVLQIRQAKAGEYVGYNATHQLTRDSVLATIAGGYADGIRRQLSNQGHVRHNALAAPMLGRVSMDTHVIDITDWPEGMLGMLDYVTILSPDHDADVMALLSDTICYDILTSIRLRATRAYV